MKFDVYIRGFHGITQLEGDKPILIINF